MKTIFLTSILTASTILATQFAYIKTSSKPEIIEVIQSIKGFTGDRLLSSSKMDFEIIEIKTGYNLMFAPAVDITIKNTSEKDIIKRNHFKAIFQLDDQVYSQASEVATSSVSILPSGASKKFQLFEPSSNTILAKLWDKPVNMKVILYLNDQKIRELPIDDVYSEIREPLDLMLHRKKTK